MLQITRGKVPYIWAGWILLNLLQAAFTELFHDEAYYWVFSQHLNWGYKDHPPAVAVFIWLGTRLFDYELGVRLVTVLSSTATLWMIWKVVNPKDQTLFFGLVGSILLVHVGGIVTVPDIPLLLFTTLFLYLFRQYLERDSWPLAACLGIALAGMAWSKYHGALVLILVLLPNLQLLKRPTAWLVPLIALALYLPHLYWQWAHDFPSFRYHFQDRGEDKYKITFVTDYLAGQLAVWGPLVSIPLFAGAWKWRAKDAFERTLKWLLWGILLFFFYQSFSQRTEPNWTSVIFLPLVYFGYHWIETRPGWKQWTFRLIVASLLLLLLFRMLLVVNVFPSGMNPRNEFHGWDVWARDVADLADGHPALFYNRFQKPSKYRFYSRQPAHCQTVDYDTGTQFDLLPESEEAVQGKTVLNIVDDKTYFPVMDSVLILPRSRKKMGYRFIPDFRSYNRLKGDIRTEALHLPPDTAVELPFTLLNPTEKVVEWDTTGNRAVQLYYLLIQYENVIIREPATNRLPISKLPPGESLSGNIRIRTPEKPGRYRYRLGLKVGDLPMGRNSRFYELFVE